MPLSLPADRPLQQDHQHDLVQRWIRVRMGPSNPFARAQFLSVEDGVSRTGPRNGALKR